MLIPINAGYYDIKYQSLMTTAGGTTISSVYPSIFVENNYVMTLTVYNNSVLYNMTGFTNWRCGIGDLGSTGPFLDIADAQFNVVGDGSDLANGILTVRINSNSAALEADLGTKTSKVYYLEIQKDSTTTPATIALFPCLVKNVVYDVA